MNKQTHIYKFMWILLCTHMYIYNHTYIYIPSWYSACFTHYVRLFAFGSTKLTKSFQVQSPFLF